MVIHVLPFCGYNTTLGTKCGKFPPWYCIRSGRLNAWTIKYIGSTSYFHGHWLPEIVPIYTSECVNGRLNA